MTGFVLLFRRHGEGSQSQIQRLRGDNLSPMTFAAPLWLIGLAPLAAVVLYLLWGRRRLESVPFLDLWLGPVKGPRPRRHLAAPPLALALAILAMLLAVVGAARPAVWDPRGGTPFTTVFDRGATMAAKGRLTDIS